jgi:hypothetical protein
LHYSKSTGTEFAKDFSAERKDGRNEKREGTERITLKDERQVYLFPN